MYGEAPGSAKVEKVIIYSIAMGLCPENNQAMGSRQRVIMFFLVWEGSTVEKDVVLKINFT